MMLQPGQPSRRSKWVSRARLRYLLAAVGLVLVATWTVISADFCAERAKSAMMISNWTSAERWLDIGSYCRGSQVKLLLIRARLSNKRGLGDQLESALNAARAAGAPASIILREQLIAAAAAGQIEPLKAKLADLLTTGEDLPEISEAFVLGCLSNYMLKDAERILDVWHADFPEDPRPHLLRGRLFEHNSDFERAATEYQKAFHLSPKYATAAFNLARVFRTQNRHEEAVTWYRTAAKLLREPQPALVGEAISLRELGRNTEARRVLLQARSRPTRGQEIVDAYRIVGEPIENATSQVMSEMGQLELADKNYSAACHAFSEALASNPRDWRTRYSYSVALRLSGNTTQAAAEVERVESAKLALNACDRAVDILKRNPRDVEARYQMGAAILDHISENQGIIWLNSALSINPHHEPTHRKLAEYFEARVKQNPEFAKQAEWHRRQISE